MAATRQLWGLRRCVSLVSTRAYAATAAEPVKGTSQSVQGKTVEEYVGPEAQGSRGEKAPIKVFGIEGRYAHALFSAASQKKALDSVEKELVDFQQMATDRTELKEFMQNPILSKDQKLTALKGILQDRKCSELTINLFYALTENNRLGRTLGVIKAYNNIMSAYRGEISCSVTSAKPLDDKTRKELETVLKGFLNKTEVLRLDLKTDPSIIGGLIVEVGDKFVDMSTSTKIKKIMGSLRETV